MASFSNQANSQSQQPPKRKRFWRRKPSGEVIDGYRVGPIRTEKAVYIESNGVVIGDIFAPKVVIAGIAHGHVVTLDLIMERGSQLWGDAFAAEIRLKPNSKMRGWINTIDTEQYDLFYMRKRPDPAYNTDDHHVPLPPELETATADLELALPSNRPSILTQLRDETSSAIASRLELEQTFNARIHEVSGVNLSEAERLRERITFINSEQSTMQQRLADLNQTLQARDVTIQTLEKELEQTTQTLSDTTQSSEELKEKDYFQTRQIDQLQADLTQLQNDFMGVTERAEQAEQRNASLETTLQSSLQRTAEQEDALVRWQELAEINEAKARRIEEQLESTKLDVQEYTQSIEMIKGQRDQIEKEWESSYKDAQMLRAQLKAKENEVVEGQEHLVRIEELQNKLNNKQHELNIIRQTMVETTGLLNQAKHKIVGLENESSTLKQDTVAKEAKFTEVLAERNSLKNQLQTAQEELASLQVRSEEDSAILNAHKAAVARIAELETLTYRLEQSEQKTLNELIDMGEQVESLKQELANADESKAPLTQEINRLKGQLAEAQVINDEIATLRQDLRFSERRINDAEDDIEVYQRQLESQGGRLAEIQTELIEREIKFNQVMEKAKQQSGELKKIKQLAGKRIQRLEQDLTAKKKQIKDLMRVIERRQ